MKSGTSCNIVAIILLSLMVILTSELCGQVEDSVVIIFQGGGGGAGSVGITADVPLTGDGTTDDPLGIAYDTATMGVDGTGKLFAIGGTGPEGPPGADGEDGAQGIQGIQGPAGADGEDCTATTGWLVNNFNWTQSNDTYRSTANGASVEATNVVNGNTTSNWTTAVGQTTDQWVAFDFFTPRTISEFAIWNYRDIYSAKNCILQTSTAITGSWTTVLSFLVLDNTDRQVFSGFTATSQYWRLFITDNYGADRIVMGEIAFYGF